MRFLLDENVDHQMIGYLRTKGHDATAVGVDHPAALSDRDVLALALAERRVLITNDKDFGELIYQRRLPHAGVILFRLQDESLDHKVDRLETALGEFGRGGRDFIVVEDAAVRPQR